MKENETVQLYCKADGNPEPTILWSKVDGSTLQGDTNKTTYSITQSKRTNSGEYKCTATNTVGGDSKEATAVVFIDVQCE